MMCGEVRGSECDGGVTGCGGMHIVEGDNGGGNVVRMYRFKVGGVVVMV